VEPVTDEPADAAVLGVEPVAGELAVEPVAGEPVEEPVAGEPVEETVQGVPVLVQARPVARPTYAALPAVQAVAVAATGFLAGAAALALVRRHAARRLVQARSVPRRPIDMLPVVGSRTFIVDIHLLAKPGE
jgi:hypothetical protein